MCTATAQPARTSRSHNAHWRCVVAGPLGRVAAPGCLIAAPRGRPCTLCRSLCRGPAPTVPRAYTQRPLALASSTPSRAPRTPVLRAQRPTPAPCHGLAGLHCDTAQPCLLPPVTIHLGVLRYKNSAAYLCWSQYNAVYRDTNHPTTLQMLQYTELYCNTVSQPLVLSEPQYTTCITIQKK